MSMQGKRVIEHLKSTGSITSMEAFQLYGITRLSARVFELKKKGYHIVKTMEVYHNRYGEPVKYARYMLS